MLSLNASLVASGEAGESNMRRFAAFTGYAVEATILGGLLWEHTSLFDPGTLTPVLLLSPGVVFLHWAVLMNGRLASVTQRSLFLLTGPVVLLSLSMVLGLTFELAKIAMLGGAPKEMAWAAANEGVPPECHLQWTRDNIARMKSERLVYAMLLASACLLYASRWSGAVQPRKLNSGSLGVAGDGAWMS